ncbi:ACR family protein [Ahniella affigens]|uniref:ACR family protein n=2 Tax=Ahniella affigens TaxID=2021234 RepID=A0A2P1PP34_9GAMM|nr:ACR family protein [Ahniella affigens]
MIAMLLALVSGCANLPTVTLKGQAYSVELALNDADRAHGLMFRTSMADDHGMLFVFPNESPRSFWMKNTKIPLDILYFDADARFVSGQFNVPTCAGGDRCPSYPSDGPAKYVLELNAGVGKRLDLRAGDVLAIPPGIKSED